AGIPKAPTYYSPRQNPDRANERKNLILYLMHRQGRLSDRAYNDARLAPTTLAIAYRKESAARQFTDAVYRYFTDETGLSSETLQYGGIKIETTLDSYAQKTVEIQAKQQLQNVPGLQTAVVVQEPNTGAIRALIGGRTDVPSAFNRALDAKRQPGSAFKPFLYYIALTQGFTPSTVLKSEETMFHFDEGNQSYTPHNFKSRYPNDWISLAEAIAVSDNIFAVKTYFYTGTSKLAPFAQQLGIDSPMQNVPSLALGTSPLSPLELTNAYSHFANGGMRVRPYFITRVTDKHGHVLYEHKTKNEPLLDAANVAIMNRLLQGMFNPVFNGYANATGLSVRSQLSQSYAGKSGSTDTDSWMVGYSPRYVTTVWTGHDRNQYITTNDEARAAKRLWATVTEQLHLREHPFVWPTPSGLEAVVVDSITGKRIHSACKGRAVEQYYRTGTAPKEVETSCTRPSLPKETELDGVQAPSDWRLF
ncbi:MAG: transglycosylase domain-containing protein, partial [Bacilli bacterium]